MSLAQLAAYVAVEVAGGPTIPFRPGRPDAYPSETTPDGRLPDAAQGREHLRDIFYRMGFSDQEIVALSRDEGPSPRALAPRVPCCAPCTPHARPSAREAGTW